MPGIHLGMFNSTNYSLFNSYLLVIVTVNYKNKLYMRTLIGDFYIFKMNVDMCLGFQPSLYRIGIFGDGLVGKNDWASGGVSSRSQ